MCGEVVRLLSDEIRLTLKFTSLILILNVRIMIVLKVGCITSWSEPERAPH